jgi:hypothetical protein
MEEQSMTKMPRIVAIISIAAGAVMIVLGAVTYYIVHRELSDEQIVVSEDAQHNAGEDVEGPFTAYSEAMVIKTHALEAGNGMTYAELPQDDPARQTVMTASFLRASLFTSVVAFGVAFFALGVGIIMILIGWALLRIDKVLRASSHLAAPA